MNSPEVENNNKLVAIMDLFLLPNYDGYEAIINAIVVDCPVQDTIPLPPFIPNIPDMSNDMPAKRFRAADCPNLPSGFFQDYESHIS